MPETIEVGPDAAGTPWSFANTMARPLPAAAAAASVMSPFVREYAKRRLAGLGDAGVVSLILTA